MNRALFVAALLALSVAAPNARADIFQWEYINPADPSQGKRQSATLAPDGAGVNAVPGAILAYRNLTMAYLIGADLTNADGISTNLTNADLSQANLTNAILSFATLTGADFGEANLTNAVFNYAKLTNADLSQANLTNASFGSATLTDADFTDAEIRGAYFDFGFFPGFGTAITLAQLYSTASYQARDLSGIKLRGNNLAGANFTGQNLTNADFEGAMLTDADFTGAEVRGATFKGYWWEGTGITLDQLYSTASYQAHDLTGVGLPSNNLNGGNFAGQNLTNAGFGGANLTRVNFREANLTNAYFGGATLTGADFHEANLTNTHFEGANLTGANLAGQNLSHTILNGATLTDADFTDAQVQGADFSYTGLALAQIYSTASYKARDLTGIHLGGDLSGADFAGQNLTNASFSTTSCGELSCSTSSATLTDADFRLANLTNVVFFAANLTDADFAGAEIRGADFGIYYINPNFPGRGKIGSGITLSQLYATGSYQAHDLSGVRFDVNVLSGGNFAGQNLAYASFNGATLADADLTDADVRGANFGRYPLGYDVVEFVGGITFSQLYSTASYQAGDLSGITLYYNDLAGGNFAGQNLTNANFYNATLTGADFTGAEVRGASFDRRVFGTGITLAQLYSTASYQAHDLSGIHLSENYLGGGNFAGQNLANAVFYAAGLTGANFRDANLANAYFGLATLTGADFTGADARGAPGLNLSGVNTTNLIRPDGHIAGLNLAAGENLIAYPGVPVPVHVSGGFSISPNATFDLTDNDLIVRATAGTKDALHSDIRALIKNAQNGVDANGLTNWNGPGITSSTARTTNVAAGLDLIALGVIRNSDLDVTGLPGSAYTTFSGQPVTPDDVLVKYTYIGDGNLDGIVSFDDYVGMDNAFSGLIPNLGWATGDINYDGLINFDDYSKVDQAFFFQSAPLSIEGNSLADVPEPNTWLLVAVSSLMLLAYAARRPKTIQD